MSVALITHPSSLQHETPPGHPERVDRIRAVSEVLEGEDLLRVTAPLAADDDVLRCHPKAYLDALRAAAPAQGWSGIDGDTFMSPGSLEAIWRAAGGVVTAVDMVLSGAATRAFSAMRPPGHHAERETAMGFCFLGNIAIGAKHALEHHGLSRVAIVDFDVHHGNGTQTLVEEDGRILFVSTHQSPLYPGTGAAHETGAHDNVLNVPLPEGTDGAAYGRMFERDVLPLVRRFSPELLLISAGFDAHRRDPLAGLRLEDEDFGWITAELVAVAEEHCGGRVVSVLEGGYDLDGLAGGVAAHVRALRGER